MGALWPIVIHSLMLIMLVAVYSAIWGRNLFFFCGTNVGLQCDYMHQIDTGVSHCVDLGQVPV